MRPMSVLGLTSIFHEINFIVENLSPITKKWSYTTLTGLFELADNIASLLVLQMD